MLRSVPCSLSHLLQAHSCTIPFHEQARSVPLVQRQRGRSRRVLPQHEVRSKGVGPWPAGKIATIAIELEGQEIVFLNGGPAHQLNPAISFFVRCDTQDEIDSYWDKLLADGGKTMACGWLTDRFGLCWQIVPRNISELIRHPAGMQAMMGMIKLDLPTLEAAARQP
jgi:predicted 3-demethylubiquinone-9 3-methyltransferase (glyoxalase superfamily)